MKNFLISLFLFSLSITGISQSHYTFAPYTSFVSVQLNDLNKLYNNVSHEKIKLNYSKQITQEYGIHLLRKKEGKKNEFGIGFSSKKYCYNYNLAVDEYTNMDSRSIYYERFIETDALGIRFLFGRELFGETKVNFIIESNIPIKSNTSIENGEESKTYETLYYSNGVLVNSSQIRIHERTHNAFSKFYAYTVPEINFQTKLFNSVSLNYGAKLKFWGLYNLYSIDVTGYYDSSQPSTTLTQSTITNTNFSFYFGLIYNLNLTTKQKKEED